MLAKSWIGLIRIRRFGEGCLWGRARDHWTEPKDGDGSVRWPCNGPTRMSIKALRCFPLFSCIRTGGGLGQRIDGEQRRWRCYALGQDGVRCHLNLCNLAREERETVFSRLLTRFRIRSHRCSEEKHKCTRYVCACATRPGGAGRCRWQGERHLPLPPAMFAEG